MQNRRWRWHSFQLFTKWTISTAPENVSALLTKGCIADFCVLCKENPQNAEMTTDFISLPDFEFEERYPDIDLICDYQKHLEKLPSIYTEIFHSVAERIFWQGDAAQLHFSKQYINRIKKKIIPISFFGQYNPQKDKSREWITKKADAQTDNFSTLASAFTIALLIAVQQNGSSWKRSVGAMILFPDIINSQS